MEILIERETPTASPRGDDDCGSSAIPPPLTELSAQGGGSESLSAQGAATVMGSSDQGAVVPPGASGVVDGDLREGGEEEGGVDEGNGGGEVAATPLDDLNIQWTTSTSGSSEEAVGMNGSGGVVVGDDGGERVMATHPVEPSAQPVMTKEGRDVVAPTEEEVIAEEAGSSEEERERATSGEERDGPRGDGVSGSDSSVSGEDGSAGGSGDDPKRKRVTTE